MHNIVRAPLMWAYCLALTIRSGRGWVNRHHESGFMIMMNLNESDKAAEKLAERRSGYPVAADSEHSLDLPA